jgi:hypothetical protein
MPRAEIKVGDVGTVYFVPTYDDDLTPANFNPTAATTKQIVFKMPGTTALITRDATAAQQDTLAGASIWGLRYTVTAGDVAAYASATVGGFHQRAGAVTLEGYVEFSSSQKWTSDKVTTDQQGRELRVVARLA